MRISWCRSHFGEGGGPITLFTWAKGLRSLGCEIGFVGEGGRLEQQVRDQGFPLYLVPKSRRPSLLTAWRYAVAARRMNADVLIGVGTFAGMEAALAALLLRKPLLLVLNVSPRQSMWPKNPDWAFPRVAPVVVVNKVFGNLCVEKYGWPRELVHHVPQRVEMSLYREMAPKTENGTGRICFLRRLDALKALAVMRTLMKMEDALRRWPQTSITIAGDGDARQQVEAIAAEMNSRIGRGAVCCVGYVDNIPQLLKTHAIVLGTERCVIEALAAGKTTFVVSDPGDAWMVTADRLDYLAEDNLIGQQLAKRRIAKASGEDIIRAALELGSATNIDQCRRWVQARYDSSVGSRKLYDLLVALVRTKERPKRPVEYLRALLLMYGILGRDFAARRLGSYSRSDGS